MNNPGAYGRGLLRRETDLIQISRSPVGIENIRAGQQCVDLFLSFQRTRIDGGRSGADIRAGIRDIVFQLVRPPEVEYVRAMQRERPPHSGPSDDVSHSQRSYARQWLRGAGRQRDRFTVPDFGDLDQREVSQHVPIMRLGQQFFGAAQHRHHHPGGRSSLLQLASSPASHGRRDGIGVVRHIQQFLCGHLDFRVEVQWHHPAIIGRTIERQPERVGRVRRRAWRISVQELPFSVIERAQPVRCDPQVDPDVLARPAA